MKLCFASGFMFLLPLFAGTVANASLERPSLGSFKTVTEDIHQITFVYETHLSLKGDEKDQSSLSSELISKVFVYDKDSTILKVKNSGDDSKVDLMDQSIWKLSSTSKDTIQIRDLSFPSQESSIRRRQHSLTFQPGPNRFQLIQKKCGKSLCFYDEFKELVAKQSFGKSTTVTPSILILNGKIPKFLWASLFATQLAPLPKPPFIPSYVTNKFPLGLSYAWWVIPITYIGIWSSRPISRVGPPVLSTRQGLEDTLFSHYEKAWRDLTRNEPVQGQWKGRELASSNREDHILTERITWWSDTESREHRSNGYLQLVCSRPFCCEQMEERVLYGCTVSDSFSNSTKVLYIGFNLQITAEELAAVNFRASRRAIPAFSPPEGLTLNVVHYER